MADDDRGYTAFLRRQDCALLGFGECNGAVRVHHSRRHTGLGIRPSDRRGMPLCTQHHIHELHALAGYFKGWDRQRLRAWEDQIVLAYNELYASAAGF